MSLSAFAAIADLEAWTGESIPDAPDSANTRAVAVLAAASTLERTFTGSPWVGADGALLWTDAVITDDPNLVMLGEAFASVCVSATARALDNPDGVVGETIGTYSYRLADAAAFPGLYLTEAEQRTLNGAVSTWRGVAAPGLGTISTTRLDLETTGVYVDVVGSDKPLPILESGPL